MDLAYWITRYLLASGVLGAILVAAEYSKGQPGRNDLLGCVAWAMLAAAIFIGTKYWNFRKAQTCTMCRDGTDQGADNKRANKLKK